MPPLASMATPTVLECALAVGSHTFRARATDATGTCARGEFRPTQPMLHVWVDEHPCGPFAGIEGSHGSGCDDHDH